MTLWSCIGAIFLQPALPKQQQQQQQLLLFVKSREIATKLLMKLENTNLTNASKVLPPLQAMEREIAMSQIHTEVKAMVTELEQEGFKKPCFLWCNQ